MLLWSGAASQKAAPFQTALLDITLYISGAASLFAESQPFVT